MAPKDGPRVSLVLIVPSLLAAGRQTGNSLGFKGGRWSNGPHMARNRRQQKTIKDRVCNFFHAMLYLGISQKMHGSNTAWEVGFSRHILHESCTSSLAHCLHTVFISLLRDSL